MTALRRTRKIVKDFIYGPEVIPWPAPRYPSVNLVFWKPKIGVNFGDELAPVVVSLMLAQRGFTVLDEATRPRELLSVGSTMHFASEGATIWGSGINASYAKRRYQFDSLDVRAVRGPKTRAFLSERGIPCPEVFGDPALLLPALTGDRFTATRETEVVFVPNLNDGNGRDELPQEVEFVTPKQSWSRAVEQILRAKFVVSSSLHGLVIAEAWGIPARYVRRSEHEGLFKYLDYYEGTGRKDFAFARSVHEALDMGGMPTLNYDPDPLIAAFPYDLWQ